VRVAGILAAVIGRGANSEETNPIGSGRSCPLILVATLLRTAIRGRCVLEVLVKMLMLVALACVATGGNGAMRSV
jgi:hypothetical protein